MADRPARQTERARDRRRRTWDGDSLGSMVEKDRLGVLLDDAGYVFADVSVFSIPVLAVVLVTEPATWYGVKTGALVAWLAMVAVGAVIRGGWVTPPATDAPGWVSLAPRLLALRLGYYNGTLALGAYGASAIASAGSPIASLGAALAVGALAAGCFPRLAESCYALTS
jgi:hypothetical protein